MRWDKWLTGLLAAVVSGAATAGIAVALGPASLSKDAKTLAAVALAAGIMTGLAYLKDHPIPGGTDA